MFVAPAAAKRPSNGRSWGRGWSLQPHPSSLVQAIGSGHDVPLGNQGYIQPGRQQQLLTGDLIPSQGNYFFNFASTNLLLEKMINIGSFLFGLFDRCCGWSINWSSKGRERNQQLLITFCLSLPIGNSALHLWWR